MNHTTLGLSATHGVSLNANENTSRGFPEVDLQSGEQGSDKPTQAPVDPDKAIDVSDVRIGKATGNTSTDMATRATVAIQKEVLKQIKPPDGAIRGPQWFSVFLNGNTKETNPGKALVNCVNKMLTASPPRAITEDKDVSAWIQSLCHNDGSIRPNLLKWAILYARVHYPNLRKELSHQALSNVAKVSIPDLSTDDHMVIANSVNFGMNSAEAGAKRSALLSELAKRKTTVKVSKYVIRDLLSNKSIPHEDVVYVITKRLLELGVLPPSEDTLPPENDDLANLQSALEVYFDVNKVSIDKFQRDVTGNYFLYRPSLHIPGYFVKALLTIDKNEIGKARVVAPLRVSENHLYQGENEGDAAVTEKWIGVMSRKSSTPYMLSCQKSAKKTESDSNHGVSRGPPRFTLFHSVLHDNTDGRVVSMTGITLSPFAGGYVMALPVCIERIRDTALIERAKAECEPTTRKRSNEKILGVFPGDAKSGSKIPLSVLGRLDRARSNIREGWQATVN